MNAKTILKNTAILLTITLVAAVALAFVYELTKEPIARAEQQKKVEAYQAVYTDAASFGDVADAAALLADYNAGLSGGTAVEEILTADAADGTQLGYVPQDNELIPDLTVLQQLRLWQRACGLRGPIPGDVSELLGLEALLPKQIKNLSGGMQRRVSIALALLSKPRVLIMDEATTGLDQSYCPHLLDYLEQFLHHGGSLIWCSHHPQELSRLCGSCLYIQNGNPSFYVPHPGTPTNQ